MALSSKGERSSQKAAAFFLTSSFLYAAISVSITSPDLNIERTNAGVAHFSGIPLYGEPGSPLLPSKRFSFLVPPDADLSSVTISIDSFAAPPRPDEYCTIYLPKIQQTLDERGMGIVLGCMDSDGVQVMQIVAKPDSMSQEQAEQIVYSDEFYTVRGPWSFTFNLGQ